MLYDWCHDINGSLPQCSIVQHCTVLQIFSMKAESSWHSRGNVWGSHSNFHFLLNVISTTAVDACHDSARARRNEASFSLYKSQDSREGTRARGQSRPYRRVKSYTLTREELAACSPWAAAWPPLVYSVIPYYLLCSILDFVAVT